MPSSAAPSLFSPRRLNVVAAVHDYFYLRRWERAVFSRGRMPFGLRMADHFHKFPTGHVVLFVLFATMWGNDVVQFFEVGGYAGFKQALREQQEDMHQRQMENVKSFNKWKDYEEKSRKQQSDIAQTANRSILERLSNRQQDTAKEY